MIKSIFHLLIIICSTLLPFCTAQAATFTGNSSYHFYPAWTPSPQRILRFTFQTSELNGVLVYSEGCDRPDYLLIRLVNGSIEAQLSLRKGQIETRTFGTFLNDNGPHILTVYHNPENLRFLYVLDGSSPVAEGYAADLVPAFGSGGVFIGGVPPDSGVPPDVGPLLNGTSFIGCLETILFENSNIANARVANSMLQALEPIATGGVVQRADCTDLCSGVSCGAGRCVPRWPDSYFCDCRGTGMLGESCSEDPAVHRLTFEPARDPTHYCHQPLPQPSTVGFNSFTLQLLPPIPSEGVLLVAHPDDGRNSFNLRVEDWKVVYEYETIDNVTRRLTLTTDLRSSNSTYQIDLNTMPGSSELILLTLDAGQTEIERLGTGTSSPLYPTTTIFSTVCIGGSLLEYKNYEGAIQNSFYGYYSLLEERNFCQLATERVSRSDRIAFVDNDIPRSLTFERFPLSSHRIVFQARSQFVKPKGSLFLVENPPYHFSVSPFNDGIIAALLRLVPHGENEVITSCFSVPAFNGEWHSFEVALDVAGENPSLTIIVDGSMMCTTGSTNFSREALPMLANSSIQFGPTHNLSKFAIFTGCLTNIELQRTPESEIFRPNLEAVPRVRSTFDIDVCTHCSEEKLITNICMNGRVCADFGLGIPAVCECHEGFVGEMCEEPIRREAIVASNISCPAPSKLQTTPNMNLNESLCAVSTTVPPPTQPTTLTPETRSVSEGPVSPSPSSTPNPPPSATEGPVSPSPSSTPNPPPSATPRSFSVGVWVGLGVAIAITLLILFGILIGICVFYRRGASIRGFYRTNESSSQDTPMIRYSASLRQLSSEIVSIDKEPSELSWSHKNGDYVNGNPPTKEVSINRTPVNRDKEFFL